jgi:hypothetical protein
LSLRVSGESVAPFWLRRSRCAVRRLAGIPALSARYAPFRVRIAPLTDLHHLQGIDRHASRYQDRSQRRSKNQQPRSAAAFAARPPQEGTKAIDSSPHERSSAPQRMKWLEDALDKPRQARLPPLAKTHSQRFYALSGSDPKIPSLHRTRFVSLWQRSQALCLQGITRCRDPTLSPAPCLPCR